MRFVLLIAYGGLPAIIYHGHYFVDRAKERGAIPVHIGDLVLR